MLSSSSIDSGLAGLAPAASLQLVRVHYEPTASGVLPGGYGSPFTKWRLSVLVGLWLGLLV